MNRVDDLNTFGWILFFSCALPMLIIMVGLLAAGFLIHCGIKPSDLRWRHQRKLDRARYCYADIRRMQAYRRRFARASIRHPLKNWSNLRECNEIIHRLRKSSDVEVVNIGYVILEQSFLFDKQRLS